MPPNSTLIFKLLELHKGFNKRNITLGTQFLLTWQFFSFLALKKGQKDASILAERSCRITADEKHGAQSVPRVSNLESNLMHQWRSLFKYMSNTWEDEGNQLVSPLIYVFLISLLLGIFKHLYELDNAFTGS